MSALTDKISGFTEFFFADFSADGTAGYPSGRVCQLLRGIGRGSETLWFNTAAKEFPEGSLVTALYGELFEAVIRFGVLPEELTDRNDNSRADFLISRASLFLDALKEFFSSHLDDDTIIPGAVKALCDAVGDTSKQCVVKRLLESDRFAHDRVFRYLDGGLVAVKPDAVKPVDKFFGFARIIKNFNSIADAVCRRIGARAELTFHCIFVYFVFNDWVVDISCAFRIGSSLKIFAHTNDGGSGLLRTDSN